MKKRSLISAFFILLLSILLLNTFKKEVFAGEIPKIAIVSLDHVPFVAGDKNELYISAKNYTGQVQYQLFYINESAMKEWKLIDNVDMVNAWTNPINTQTPIIIDISKLNLKAAKYKFAIRVRRVGVKGLKQNKYGDYDDAYPFNVDVVKNANVELNGEMGINKTQFTQDEILTINSVDSSALTVEYKLHLFDVKNSKWLTNLTEYNMNTSYSLKNIPEGTYIVDLWAKNNESKNKYDGWKLKVITINNTVSKGDSVISNKTTELTTKQIVGKYGNAVVYIEVSDENHKAIASGSGFIVNSNGVVVTNFHVIKGCTYANVTLQNGTKYDVKSVLNYNEKQDIAILQLSNATNLSIVKLGNSDTLELADNVVAIGSPKGYENTLSTGIISGINRKSVRGNDFQTNASITHGSSGGALFDMYGNVVGITYSGYDSSGDIGFVIPINEINPFLNSSNEKTLMQVNDIKGNTMKYLPLLSDVPQPIGINYKNYIISKEKNYVFYLYDMDKFNYISYYKTLDSYGWKYYETGKDAKNNPLFYFTKGNSVITIGWSGSDRMIFGDIH